MGSYASGVDRSSHKARYRVRLRDTKGFTEFVTVWADGPKEAIERTKVWFEVMHDLGQVWTEQEAEWIGSDSDPSDLEVAESNEVVNNQSYSPDGEVLSTKFRIEPEHLRRSTRLMRESPRPSWSRLREQLTQRGVDLSDVAVGDISVHEPDPQNPIWLVVRGFGRTILVYSATHDSLDELDARYFWDRTPALQAAEAILESEGSTPDA